MRSISVTLILFGILFFSPGLCPAGDMQTSTVTIFDYKSGAYRSYEIQSEGNVTEVFSWQNANTVRIEQTSPGEFEVFDYGLGKGLDVPKGLFEHD